MLNRYKYQGEPLTPKKAEPLILTLKEKRMKFLATFALLCVCVGSLSAAELSDAERVVLEDQARRDAEKEGDEKFWALATFAGTTLVSPYLSLPALAGAWYYQPAPPAYRFRGKSPVAIEIYTHTYNPSTDALRSEGA